MTRKTAVTSFVLLCALAIAIPASAQVSFNVFSSAQTVRTEGQTETAGSVTLNWATGARITGGTSSISITYGSAAVTSPGVVTAKVAGGPACTVAVSPAVPGTGGTCANILETVTAGSPILVISFPNATPGGDVPPAPATFVAGDYIQIQQVRLNVAAFTGAQLVTGTQTFLATISGNSPNSNTITFNQNQVQVALIQNSLNVKLGGTATESTCAVATLPFSVTATEVYPAALTSAADEAAFTPGIAPTGTVVNVILTNVPTGFQVTPLALTTSGTAIAVTAIPGAQVSTGVGTPLVFSYTVLTTNTSIVETQNFNFNLGLASGTIAPTLAGQTLSSPQSISAQVYLGPVTNTATTIVRFTQLNYPASPIVVATISDCVSILLFPYVTNEAGFDTSLQIANTSLDAPALGTQLASKQNGTCKFVLYPTAAATGAIGTTQNSFVTPSITAGGSYQVLLSKAYPKLSGYMFAVCNFLNAHGFGYFVGPSSNGGVLTQGELALVVPTTRAPGVTESLTQ